MRRIVLAATAIAVFTAAALAAVWALTRDGSGRAAAGLAPDPAAPLAPGTPRASSAAPIGPAQPTVEAVVVYAPPKVEPPKDSWEAVAVAPRPSALGPLGGAIGRALNELQPRLAACFDEDTAARFGPQPRSVARDASLPDGGNPVLVLHIETGSGEARIVDAPVDAQGSATEGVVSCAQSILRGRRIQVPQAQPGQRYRMLHTLLP